MRIVFLTHNYPRHPGDVAGAFLDVLARGLRDRGHAITVLAPSDRGGGGEEQRDGIRIRRLRYAAARRETLAYTGRMQAALGTPAGLAALLGMWRAFRRAAAVELAGGADVLHAHWWFPAGLALPAHGPAVLTSHGTDVALLRRSAVARFLARPVYRRAQVVTAVSAALARTIEQATGRSMPADCITPMPVEVDRFTWSRGGRGLLIIARLTRQKRVDLALRAVAALRSGGRPIPLTIAGDGPARGELEQLAASLALGELVRFLGAVPPQQVPELLAGADAMLFPARGEGLGLSAAEALMAGVPVVACQDGGGVLDVVPPTGAGRVVAPVPGALAAAVQELLADRAAAEAARHEGERWRIRLAADTVAGRCEAWYTEARRAAGVPGA